MQSTRQPVKTAALDNPLFAKIIDSTAMIAMASGLLYLVGEAHISFSAYGYGYPSTLLKYEFWEVIGVGGQTIITFPLLIDEFDNRWPIVLYFAVITLLVMLYVRLRAYGSLAFIIIGIILTIVTLCFFAFVSHNAAKKRLQIVMACLVKSSCQDGLQNTRIRYQITDNTSQEQDGYILSAKGDFILLKTKEGFSAISKLKASSLSIQ